MIKTWYLVILVLVASASAKAQISVVSIGKIVNPAKLVKNAPFSADAVSESVQTLPDGNRIVRRASSHLYRDSEGRFRREDMSKQLGLGTAVIDMPETILIMDPVAGFMYTLNPKTNTLRQTPFRIAFDHKLRTELNDKMKMALDKVKEANTQLEKEAKETAEQDAGSTNNAGSAEQAAVRARAAEDRKVRLAERQAQIAKRLQDIAAYKASVKEFDMASDGGNDSKTESLGVENIEGVQAEGTRTTTTIAAGKIGNERPIDIVYEKWYSKDLQLIVLSKHNDPRSGEQTYKLTNIRRDEPASTLFTPPADYKVVEGNAPKPRTVVVTKPAAVIKIIPSGPAAPAKPPAVPKKNGIQ